MKHNIDYFRHDNDMGEHPRSQALIAVYGYEGYGRWNRLNELIAKADHCQLDLSRRVFFNGIANKLQMSPDEFESFLTFLADPDECGLIHREGNVITSDRTQEDLEARMTAREAARERRNRTSPKTPQSSPNSSEVQRRHADANDKGKVREGKVSTGEGKGKVREGKVGTTDPLFHTWLQDLAKTERGYEKPERFADKVVNAPQDYPDLVERYDREKPRPPGPRRAQAPHTCPHCEATDWRNGTTNRRICRQCGAVYDYDETENQWVVDPESVTEDIETEADVPFPTDSRKKLQKARSP